MSERRSATRPPQPLTGGQLFVAFLVAGAWLAVTLLPLSGVPKTAHRAPAFDAHIYLAMAEAPTVFTMPPFAYRIGVPLLAHLLPFPVEINFFLLTLLGLLATLTLAYVFFRELGFGHGLALLGLSFVAAAPEVTVYLRNHFLVDPLALAFMTGLLIAIERRVSAGPMALLLLVASLFKESAFYVVPVMYLRLAAPGVVDRRAAWRVLAISSPAIAAALILRFGWGGAFQAFPYLSPWGVQRDPWFGSMEVYQQLWSGLFGYLLLLAIANAFTDRWREFVRCYLPYLALVIAQLLVPMNAERLLFFGFPVIIPLALAEFQRVRDELPEWFPYLATLLVFCYLFIPSQLAPPLILVALARFLIERRGAPE